MLGIGHSLSSGWRKAIGALCAAAAHWNAIVSLWCGLEDRLLCWWLSLGQVLGRLRGGDVAKLGVLLWGRGAAKALAWYRPTGLERSRRVAMQWLIHVWVGA